MWKITLHKRIVKNLNKLPVEIQERFKALAIELKVMGPIRHQWPNYGKIRGIKDCHHCHLKKGKPTYVAVWKVPGENTLEVIYVGTHEKADYRRLC